MIKKLTIFSAMFLVGCASQPEDIQTSYVSTMQYANYDCQQLAMESDRISRRVSELYGNLKKKADNDAVQMGVGLVLFWPTLFFLEGGDGPEAQEYARLKGDRDALEKVAVQRKCGIEFKPLIPKKADTDKAQKVPDYPS